MRRLDPGEWVNRLHGNTVTVVSSTSKTTRYTVAGDNVYTVTSAGFVMRYKPVKGKDPLAETMETTPVPVKSRWKSRLYSAVDESRTEVLATVVGTASPWFGGQFSALTDKIIECVAFRIDGRDEDIVETKQRFLWMFERVTSKEKA